MEMTQLNKLQMPTFKWLKLNTAAPVLTREPAYFKKTQVTPTDTAVVISDDTQSGGFGELPEDIQEILDNTAAHLNVGKRLTIPAGADIAEPLMIDFELDQENAGLYDLIRIDAGKDSQATVVLRYHGESRCDCFRCGLTYLEVADGARLTVIVQQSMGTAGSYTGAIYGRVGAAAYSNVVIAELGAAVSTANCMLELAGERSEADIESLYMADNDQRKDLKYNLRFSGRETVGSIIVKGALSGSARKILKSNIDFVKGARGAAGREAENVLVLSDRVTNISVPLLLCGEDDVAGEHATSTGKPDEGKLFYLMSRGFSPGEARKLLVEASFTPVLDKLPEVVRTEVMKHIREVIHDE